MNQEYRLDKEYTVIEIIRYNLKKWWLALICAAVCAAALGGYKVVSLYPYLEKDAYENIHQVTATLYAQQYSDESAVERVTNIMRMAGSYRAYELVKEKTGLEMDYPPYQLVFDIMQGEAGDVATIYLTYPVNIGAFSIADENAALAFTNAIIEATDELSQELVGKKCFLVLDAPYLSNEVKEVESYSITKDDFQKGVLKAVTAGVLLGIIVEVVLYSFWLILSRKPKSVNEIRECLEVPVIDDIKKGNTNEEEVFKKVALFLRGKKEENTDKKCVRINSYLDKVCRDTAEEKGYNIVMNERFEAYLNEKGNEYDCIVVNSPDVIENADAYAASKICDKTFVVCARTSVDNETLYRLKSTVSADGIAIEGVLVYEL